MLLDKPDLLATALPGLIPVTHTRWAPGGNDGFLTGLTSAMGVGKLMTGRHRGSAGVVIPPYWHELILISDCPCSQYDALRRTLSSAGTPPGNIACVALTGQGFHGQHGRQWTAIPGNLHLSAIITCDLPVAEFAPVMPALPAVAVTEAVATLVDRPLAPGIKWVNDILLKEHKVAGVLTALRTHRGRITAVVLGVGVNVAVAPVLSGDELALPATSLGAVRPDDTPDLGVVLATVLEALRQRFLGLEQRGPADLLATYRNLSLVVGRQVTIWPDAGSSASSPVEPLCSGEVSGIEPDLSLRLRGVPEAVTGGRLTFAGPGT